MAHQSDIDKEIEGLKATRLYWLHGDLMAIKIGGLRGIAERLGVPTRYDNNALKSKDVLVAALYEHFRSGQQLPASVQNRRTRAVLDGLGMANKISDKVLVAEDEAELKL